MVGSAIMEVPSCECHHGMALAATLMHGINDADITKKGPIQRHHNAKLCQPVMHSLIHNNTYHIAYV